MRTSRADRSWRSPGSPTRTVTRSASTTRSSRAVACSCCGAVAGSTFTMSKGRPSCSISRRIRTSFAIWRSIPVTTPYDGRAKPSWRVSWIPGRPTPGPGHISDAAWTPVAAWSTYAGEAPRSSTPRRPRSSARDGRSRCALLLRRQHVTDSPQGQCIAGDSKAGHDALTDRGSLGCGTATDRVGDVHLRRRELDLRDSRNQGRIAGAERRGIEDGGIEALLVGGIEPVDDLALDVRVENLDVHAELFGVAADALVIFGQRHGTEDIDLDLAAHVHAGAVDHQYLGHLFLRSVSGCSILAAPTGL